jgi:PhzF family phenazine biosynthesis protein
MEEFRRTDIGSASGLKFRLTDVFGSRPFSGNPLPVVFSSADLEAQTLLRITQEFAQFETIFLTPTKQPGRWNARVFDLIEELPFAGHPLIGAAAAIVDVERTACPTRVELLLGERCVAVDVTRGDGYYVGRLDAGQPRIEYIARDRVDKLLRRFNLASEDLMPSLQPAVVDTGLRYLVLPVTSRALASAVIDDDIGDLVRCEGAQFAVLVDVVEREIRHWSNDGKTEDIATGSAASVVGAYLVTSGILSAAEPIVLAQGRFLGRPSVLTVETEVVHDAVSRVYISGNVHLIGEGRLQVPP